MKGESRFATPGDCSIFILRLDVVVHIRGIHTRTTSCHLIDNPSGLSSGFKGIALPIAERKSPYFFSVLCTGPTDVGLRLDFRGRLIVFISSSCSIFITHGRFVNYDVPSSFHVSLLFLFFSDIPFFEAWSIDLRPSSTRVTLRVYVLLLHYKNKYPIRLKGRAATK